MHCYSAIYIKKSNQIPFYHSVWVFASRSLLDRNQNLIKRFFKVIIDLLVMSILRGEKLLAKVMTLHVMSIAVYGCMNNVNKEYARVYHYSSPRVFQYDIHKLTNCVFFIGDIISIREYLLCDILTCMLGTVVGGLLA